MVNIQITILILIIFQYYRNKVKLRIVEATYIHIRSNNIVNNIMAGNKIEKLIIINDYCIKGTALSR